jgi:signal transduction histidine kinase
MAGRAPELSAPGAEVGFARERIAALLEVLEHMAAGDTTLRLPVSELHDELDAIAYCVNVLVGELEWAGKQVHEAQEARAAELRAAVVSAERANATKSTFLRNVSHEIRTPIAALLGFADLLATPDLPEAERADLVRRLQSNGQAVLSLLGDLLDLARVDADRVALSPEAVSVFEVVREVIATHEIETQAKGLDVRLEVTGEALAQIRTDRHRLRQILVNLIGNAVKFTKQGTIVVSVRVERSDEGDRWIVDVSDTGIGISPERHASVFEPFEQGEPSIARTYGGTGLGLALSRKLAERMHGSLELLRSAPNEGSLFRLTLGRLKHQGRSTELASELSNAPAGGIRGMRILLAEDHPDMQLAVRRFLELEGATVELARDGREAVAKARASEADVVLMDLWMPHMDGLQATRVLRGEGYRTPIIAITADPATTHRVQALEAGCDECLSKPFSPMQLLGSIRAQYLRSVADS